MKKLIMILTLIVSTNLFAKEYTCYKSNFKLVIDLYQDRSTHLWLYDRYNHHLYQQSYAGSIDRGNKVTSFYFYGRNEPVIISFMNTDILNQEANIRGHIDTMIDGFIVKGYFDCDQSN